MHQLDELIRRHDELFDTYGKNDNLFIRPDESDKTFDGKVLRRELFHGWHTTHLARVPLDTLCVVSTPVDIANEYRLVIRRNRVITGSAYVIDGAVEYHPLESRPERDQVARFAESVASDNPPEGLPPIYLMDLARYWSGGCGVYHIIGELLAETAMKDPEFSATMSRFGRQPVTLLLSAGGGTGGGISGAFRQQPPDGLATLPNVRLFAVLPELDQFQDGGADISGPDSPV